MHAHASAQHAPSLSALLLKYYKLAASKLQLSHAHQESEHATLLLSQKQLRSRVSFDRAFGRLYNALLGSEGRNGWGKEGEARLYAALGHDNDSLSSKPDAPATSDMRHQLEEIVGRDGYLRVRLDLGRSSPPRMAAWPQAAEFFRMIWTAGLKGPSGGSCMPAG
jgi:hypothetical protein